LPSNEFFHSQKASKALLARDLSQTPLWKLTALPSPTKWFKGASRQEHDAKGQGKGRKEWEMRKKRRGGEGREGE